MTVRRSLLLLLITCGSMLVVACGSDASDAPVGTTSPPTIPSQLEDFVLTTIDVAGRPWRVAVADTGELRSQGLMGVTDLGGLNGMIFEFEEDTTATFHMLDTLLPLDIAFFAADGALVSIRQMAPCKETPCDSYAADGPYRYALEAPLGALIDLPPDAVLDVGGR